MDLAPSADYRRAFKRGMRGTDVASLQINLGRVTVDGIFGAQTETAVEVFQEQRNLTVDGIAGLETQRHLCRIAAGPYQKQFNLPSGSLISIANNESSFLLATYSPSLDGGYDLGAFQRHLKNPSQAQIRAAYDLDAQAKLTGETLRRQRDEYADPWPVDSWYVDHVADGSKGHMAWQLGFLYHNWPEAADHIARHGSIHSDPSKDTEDSDWVIYFSAGRLRSDREWIVSYIERATVFVTWPSS